MRVKRLIATEQRIDALDRFGNSYQRVLDYLQNAEESIEDMKLYIQKKYENCESFLKATIEGRAEHEDMSEEVDYCKEDADFHIKDVEQSINALKQSCYLLFDNYGKLTEDVTEYNRNHGIKYKMSDEEREQSEKEAEQEAKRVMKLFGFN